MSEFVDNATHRPLINTCVLELEARWERRVEEDSTGGRGAIGLATIGFTNDMVGMAILNQRVKADVVSFVRTLDLFKIAEDTTLTRTTVDFFSQVVRTDDHVLRRRDE